MALYPTLPDIKGIAEAFRNDEEQVNPIREGLSHGNPANIKEGETVVYLGFGSGIDVFLAARKVGPTGSVIGLDISEDMITAARKNAVVKGLKPPQVAFVKAPLTENLPIEPNSVEYIFFNPVVNSLPPEGRASLFKEVNRILRPEGRVILDDIVAKKPIPENIKNDIAAHFATFSRAIIVEEYRSILKEAGLSDIVFVETKHDLSVDYENRQDGTTSPGIPTLLGVFVSKLTYDINEWVGTYQIHAVKRGSPVEKPPTALSHWWDAYPTAKSSPSFMTAEEIVALKKDPATSTEFAVIDVRRGDHGGGHVRGSDNWAAQTFYDDLPAFYEKYKDTTRVIFYCSKSNGRGPRYQDYLDSREDHKSTAYVLKGGVKNWLTQYGDNDDLVDRD